MSNPESWDQSVAILSGVATVDRPPVAEVITALLTVEKKSKQTAGAMPLSVIAGTWQLRFASGAKKTKRGLKLGKGYYWPSWVDAAISFDPTGRIQNQVRLGGLVIRFTGPCRAHDKRQIVAFDFTQLQVLLGERVLFSRSIGKYPEADFATRPISKLPFFVFLWTSGEAIAARGRGGGLAIWVKDSAE